jgi:integrase/recombinase XerD
LDYHRRKQIPPVYIRLSEKTGLKKGVCTHLSRHSRATELASMLTEAQLKGHLAWVQESKAASKYVPLSGRDIDDVLLKAHGIPIDELKRGSVLIAFTCLGRKRIALSCKRF